MENDLTGTINGVRYTIGGDTAQKMKELHGIDAVEEVKKALAGFTDKPTEGEKDES